MEDVIKCFGISISRDSHVILLKGPSCSLVLVRPWMQELHVIYKIGLWWTYQHQRGLTSCTTWNLQRAFKFIKEKETSINNGKQEVEHITSYISSCDRNKKLLYMVSKDEGGHWRRFHLSCGGFEVWLFVVVPKKNDINFKSLHDSTKRDQISPIL